MNRKIICTLLFVFLLCSLLAGCSGSDGAADSQQTTSSALATEESTSQETTTTEAPETTLPAETSESETRQTTVQETTEPPVKNDIVFDELDALDNYSIVLTVAPQSGKYAKTRTKYEATCFPSFDSYTVTRFFAEKEKEYVFAEESTKISCNEWTVNLRGDYAQQISLTSVDYVDIVKALYGALYYGDIELVEETAVSGLNTKHYSFTRSMTGTLEYGDVWILEEEGLPHIPLAYTGTHAALDDKGNKKMDARYKIFKFDISNINSAPMIMPLK